MGCSSYELAPDRSRPPDNAAHEMAAINHEDCDTTLNKAQLPQTSDVAANGDTGCVMTGGGGDLDYGVGSRIKGTDHAVLCMQ